MKRKYIIICMVLVFSLLSLTLFGCESSEAREEYLKPFISDAELLSTHINELTKSSSLDLTPYMEEVGESFKDTTASLKEVGKAFSSKVTGLYDFNSLMGHCFNKYRAWQEAYEVKKEILPSDIVFMYELGRNLNGLTEELRVKNLSAEDFSKAVTSFNDKMQSIEKELQ